MAPGRYRFILVGIPLMFALAGAGLAQPDSQAEYRLGVGDLLQLNVPQLPDLDGTLTIRPDGTVAISRVGSVAVAGLTLMEAEQLVRQRLRLFNPSIEEVTLTVTEYNALRVYVLGSVATPGSYTFTSPPTIWDAIRAAGGPTQAANLRLVRLIRQQTGAARSTTFDLSAILSGQGILPTETLLSGDTVVIPVREGVPQVPAAGGVQVFGSVAAPGTISIGEATRLMTVLMLAGSPLVDSQLEQVWWVHGEGGGEYRATRVNMKLFLEKGSLAGNPLVHPGDTVRVPRQQAGWFRRNLEYFLGTAAATAAIFIAVDRLSN